MPVTVVRVAGASTATASTAALRRRRRPRPRRSRDRAARSRAAACAVSTRFHALAIEPAGHRRRAVRHRRRGGVGIDAAAQPVGHAGQGAGPARGGGREHDGGARGAAERLGRRGVGGVARLARRPRRSTARKRAAPQPAIWSAAAWIVAPTSPTVSVAAQARAPRSALPGAALASEPSASV